MADTAEIRKEESSSTNRAVQIAGGKRFDVDLLILPILALAGALYFVKLGGAPVSNPDEGLYAEIPREMAETGDYLTPHCNFARYHDKPPLMAWLTAGMYKVFGVSEFTARFWTAACALV